MCLHLCVTAQSMMCMCAAARPPRAFLCVPLLTIVSSCPVVHSQLQPEDGLPMLHVCVCLRGLAGGGLVGGVILPHLGFTAGVIEVLYRRGFGEDRKGRCMWLWPVEQRGGDGRWVTLHLLSVALVSLKHQETPVWQSKKKWILFWGLLFNFIRRLTLWLVFSLSSGCSQVTVLTFFQDVFF